MQILDRSTILSRMITTMRANDSEITYFGPGPVRAFLYSVATECQMLYYKLFQVEQRSDLMTASGTALDTLARARGLSRLGASPASVVVTLTGSKASAFDDTFTLAAGIQITTSAGQAFLISGTVEMTPTYAGSRTAMAKAIAVSTGTGLSQNVATGTLTQLLSPTVVGLPQGVTLEARNDGPAQGGADEESDAELRTRVAGIFAGLNQGTRAFYDAQVRAINPDITRVYVGRGPELGQVKVYCATRSGASLTEPERIALEKALAEKTPVQTYVSVENMVFIPIDIAFSSTIRAGYTIVDAANQVGAALSEYLNWTVWPFETAVQADDLLRICSGVEAVDDLAITSFSILQNVSLEKTQLPRLGSVTITDPTTLSTLTLTDFYNDFPRLS